MVGVDFHALDELIEQHPALVVEPPPTRRDT
jgi:hypothetical protein